MIGELVFTGKETVETQIAGITIKTETLRKTSHKGRTVHHKHSPFKDMVCAAVVELIILMGHWGMAGVIASACPHGWILRASIELMWTFVAFLLCILAPTYWPIRLTFRAAAPLIGVALATATVICITYSFL